MDSTPQDALKIYVDRLRDGSSEVLHLELPASLFEVEEEELELKDKVIVDGSVYLADSDLIAQLDLRATATMPCKVCNDATDVEINAAKLYHVQSVSEIASGVLDLSPLIREQLLLECPRFTECGGGKCPTRAEIAQYLVPADEL